MEDYFASGHAADAMLVALALEGLWLVWRNWRPWEALAMLLPAALMVIGLRGALTGAAWPWIAVPLALSLPAHLVDLGIRESQSWFTTVRALGRRRQLRRARKSRAVG